MGDLISRQAILKHIEKTRHSVLMMVDINRASIIMTGMELCEKAVRNQPSAQPEIIRCKDCKFIGTDATCCHVCNREGMGLRPFHVYHDDFCSYAEKADMSEGQE